jgi:hypothetical protein
MSELLYKLKFLKVRDKSMPRTFTENNFFWYGSFLVNLSEQYASLIEPQALSCLNPNKPTSRTFEKNNFFCVYCFNNCA